MSIGLPAHLRYESVSRAFARTVHTISFMCFALALAGVLSFDIANSDVVLWPAALAMVPMLITVWAVNRFRTKFFAVAHVVIGGLAIYWYSVTVISALYPLGPGGQYLVALPIIALTLIGGAAGSVGWTIIWCTIGLVVGAGVVSLAAWQLVGHSVVPVSVPGIYVATIVVILILRLSQRGVRRVQSRLHRAARDNELATLRYGIEATSAAMVHDTVLGHLAAIANAPYGAINPQLQRDIRRDLDLLVGQEWLSKPAESSDNSAHDEWQDSSLFDAVAEAREMGLTVEVTGDPTVLSDLKANAALALGQAVKQCLVNVLKHSGTEHAEVAIFASPEEVSVLVVDAGKGFDEAENGADRLGLRQSVRRRIEQVDGAVQVWSTPGLGTSVMIRVPTEARERAESGSGGV